MIFIIEKAWADPMENDHDNLRNPEWVAGLQDYL